MIFHSSFIIGLIIFTYICVARGKGVLIFKLHGSILAQKFTWLKSMTSLLHEKIYG